MFICIGSREASMSLFARHVRRMTAFKGMQGAWSLFCFELPADEGRVGTDGLKEKS